MSISPTSQAIECPGAEVSGREQDVDVGSGHKRTWSQSSSDSENESQVVSDKRRCSNIRYPLSDVLKRRNMTTVDVIDQLAKLEFFAKGPKGFVDKLKEKDMGLNAIAEKRERNSLVTDLQGADLWSTAKIYKSTKVLGKAQALLFAVCLVLRLRGLPDHDTLLSRNTLTAGEFQNWVTEKLQQSPQSKATSHWNDECINGDGNDENNNKIQNKNSDTWEGLCRFHCVLFLVSDILPSKARVQGVALAAINVLAEGRLFSRGGGHPRKERRRLFLYQTCMSATSPDCASPAMTEDAAGTSAYDMLHDLFYPEDTAEEFYDAELDLLFGDNDDMHSFQ